ncbi:MAG TPA: prepilin-type N-terminal cleavage/methylation domain-containing protein [Nitrospirales bacterium]|nr:prepilin-type N-terminal cleavage/methylation domain-containing protein [Nitrospirales bacterium]
MNNQPKIKSIVDRTHGFTLIELSVSMGLLAVIAVLAFTALGGAARTVSTSNAWSDSITNVHQILMTMTSELEMASTDENPVLNVVAIAVTLDGEPVAAGIPGNEVTFQIPVDAQGTVWSQPILFRYITEDDNGNGLLDSGEDDDGDDVLSRRIIRVDTSDGSTTVIGSANNVSNVTFQLDAAGDALTIALQANTAIANTRRIEDGDVQTNLASSTATRRIYLSNTSAQ